MRPVAKKVGAWQSPMKITKRLIASIIMLALSVAFCVWAVFAWFSQNSRVDATGMQVEVEVEDLKLEVELYSLAYVTVKGTQRYEITGELQGNMPQYGSGQCTAILVRMTATNSNATEDRTAALSVTSNGGTTFTQDTDNNGTLLDSFSGALSNAISFSGVSYDGADATNTYALTGTPVSFVGNRGLSSKSTEVFLIDITIPAGQSVVRNYILDYDSDSLSAVYDAILNDSNLNASPSAVVNLQNDLTICLGNTVGGTNISTSDDSNTEGACRHKVTLNYNYQVSSEDGTSSYLVETYEVINGEKYTPPAPEREGFTFGGWFMDSALSTQYTPRAITVNTTLYAKWDDPSNYVVTFNATFGSFDTGETITTNVESGERVQAPEESPTITVNNVVFGGWYSDETWTTVFNFDNPITANITLYARWLSTNTTNEDFSDLYSAVGDLTDRVADPSNRYTLPRNYTSKNIFTYYAGVRFQTGSVNTQGNDIAISLSNEDALMYSITYEGTGASSSGSSIELLYATQSTGDNGNNIYTADGAVPNSRAPANGTMSSGTPFNITVNNLSSGAYILDSSNSNNITTLSITEYTLYNPKN